MSVWYRGHLRALPDPRNECGRGCRCQDVSVKYPGAVRERMRRLDFATFHTQRPVVELSVAA